VRKTSFGRDADLATESSDVGDTSEELLHENVIGDVENSSIEDSTVLVHLANLHTVLEGFDVQLGKQSLGRKDDAFSRGTDLEISGDFDGTLDDLGRDVQSLERRFGTVPNRRVRPGSSRPSGRQHQPWQQPER